MGMAEASASGDTRRLLRTRGLRASMDGLVAVVLPVFLLARGFSPTQVGAVVTATLLGSAAITMTIGLRGGHLDRVHLLQLMCLLMVATGLAFGMVAAFGALLVVAAVGTINPSAGDVSAFLPIEQALLPDTVAPERRTHVFAHYALVASLAGAVGSLAAGVPGWIAGHTRLSPLDAQRGVFFLYALVGLVLLAQYRRLAPRPPLDVPGLGRSGLGRSRAIVVRLALLFSVDAFGGGFVVQSILVLWLSLRFDLSTATAGAVFFWVGMGSASSALLAPKLAARIGLVRTMVFTHVPANLLLIAAAFMPSAGPAIACLLLRSLLSQMDVPARTSYVMAVVDPAERTAAATITNVPRSLAAALPPLVAGVMLQHSTFGWPLIIAGCVKIVYDLTLLALFHDVRPPEEIVGEAT
ncbi:MAG: MFS transporter [Acidimicrobiia bacterium]|nr:MFS transporter [Acidimicrobiia bacterium]